MSEVASVEEDMEESLISNRDGSRHTDSRSADIENAFGSTGVEREHILEHLDRQAPSESACLSIWIDERQAKAHLAVHWNHRLAHS